MLAGPAEIVGRCFPGLPPLTAYRWDLIGSLIGIGGFTVLSFLWAPPVVWGVIVALAFVVLVPNLSGCWRSRPAPLIVGVLLVETMAPGTSWSPYYKITTEDVVPGNPDFVDISVNGIPHQLMAPAQWKLEQGEQQYATPYLRIKDNSLDDVLIVGAGSGSDVAIALSKGAKPHRRRRHRPADHADRRRAQPRPALPGPAGDPARQRRAGVPDGHRQEVRPDPLRAARLADARQRRLADPARVVPVHRPGDRGGPRPPQAGRRVRDVQLLPRGLADRPAGRHRRRRLRPHPVRGHLRRRPGRRHGRPRPGQPAVRDDVPALGRGDRAGHRRPPVPLLQGRRLPEPLPLGDRGDPARLRDRAASARRAVPVHAAVRRPVLHGRGVPAAGDQERRDLRACCSAPPGW